MDNQNIFHKIETVVSDMVTFVGWLIWAFIKAIATIITFSIIFALLSAIIPIPLMGTFALIFLIWLIYTHRQSITTIIAFFIACMLALALVNSIKYSLFPDWVMVKYAPLFRTEFMYKKFGSTEIKSRTVNNLTIHGTTDLDDMTINGPLAVYGRLHGSDLKVKGAITIHGQATLHDIVCADDVTIHGQANLKGIDVSGDLVVHGQLNIKRGSILGTTHVHGQAYIDKSTMADLMAHSEEITIKNSTLKNITLKQSYGRKIVVTLIDSTVDGNITFENENGIVVLKNDAKVQGKIIGGTAEQE